VSVVLNLATRPGDHRQGIAPDKAVRSIGNQLERYEEVVSQLIVLGFRDLLRGAEVLNDLKRRDLDWVADLDHAVVLTLDAKGGARVQLSVDLGRGETATWAALWGSLLSLTLIKPTADIIRAVDGISAVLASESGASRRTQNLPSAGWWNQELQLDDLFLRDLAAMLKTGGSALFMLLHTQEGFLVMRELQNYGNMIIHTTLSPDQDRKIDELFPVTWGSVTTRTHQISPP